jgi:LysM repeat protein
MVLPIDRKFGDPISSDGYRIDNENGNKEDKSKNWTAAINAVKTKIEQSGHNLPPNAHYVVVEKGDCLWRIAEQYGEDPEQLIADNGPLFKNPNLIHPGDVVVVRGSDANKDAWTPAPSTSDVPDPGVQPTTSSAPIMGPYATNTTPTALSQIKADSAQFDQYPTAQNGQKLETDVSNYLGDPTSPGFADRVHTLTQIDCGGGSISKTIPTVVGKKLHGYREEPSTNLVSHTRSVFHTVLAALPESERKGAAQKMMQGLSGDQFMQDQLKSVAKDDFGIKL